MPPPMAPKPALRRAMPAQARPASRRGRRLTTVRCPVFSYEPSTGAASRGSHTGSDSNAFAFVRGHTLVWGLQLPRWVTGTDWTREELLRVMQEHITTVVGRYRGRIAEWDVVNEPLAADGSLARNVWLDVIGPDYVEHALRFAHAADPAAKLFVNEIAAEHVSTKAEGSCG